MERSMTPKGQASRARLLEAAAKEFAEKGFAATKISDIVKAAGLTQAAFYLYFPSKETVFTELVTQFCEHLERLAHAGNKITAHSPDQAADQVRENLRAVFTFLRSKPELTRIALYESAQAETIKENIIQMIIHNVKRNQEAGHLRADLVPEVVAECIVGIFERLSVKWLLTGKKDPDTLAAEMADMILYGVLAHR